MYLGEKEIKECPHKTVSRSYNSPSSTSPQWRCDWCGQEFSQAIAVSKTVEINEATGTNEPSALLAKYGPAVAPVLDSRPAKKKEKSYVS
jgi:hypothetical protein